MAIADDLTAEVAKLKSAVDLAVALIGNLRAQANTLGLNVEQANALLTSIQGVETTLTAAVNAPTQ